MKSLAYAIVTASLIAAPLASFAQSNSSAPAKAEEVSGSAQSGAAVNARNGAAQTASDTSGYGREAVFATQGGIAAPRDADGIRPLFSKR